MSGDNIRNLKMVTSQPLNLSDLEYTKKLLEPFEDIVVERFESPLPSTKNCNKGIFVLIAIGLILLINFPKVREKSGLNDYILWLISAFLLFGVVY
ncbi:hypothetical protein IIV30_005L [Invertebrate iridescent virus 30]|uniref:Uncharacterized protein n=1 Tax=Invertebrate iridescent virus 30 TaxID=345585 RepID=W8W2H2_9VIRU|nr:hypothetical protein IIV30_005L [Invertebrate iridescent virus 30]CCV02200.1 hypothetical protein IIV30_005L [Invertebrate iridescent virus 30]